MKIAKFWLNIQDASIPDTKDVEMRMWNGVEEEWKHLRRMISCNFLPREVVKKNLKEQIMKAVEVELDKYIDDAFKW